MDVPGGIHEAQVDKPDIAAHSLNILQVPERECIVIPVGEEDGIFFTRLEHIVRIVPCHVIARAVVFMVVDPDKIGRNGKDEKSHDAAGEEKLRLLAGLKLARVIDEGQDPHGDPH